MRYNAIHRRAGQHDNPGRAARRRAKSRTSTAAPTLLRNPASGSRGIADQSTAGAMNDKIDGFGERCKRASLDTSPECQRVCAASASTSPWPMPMTRRPRDLEMLGT